jgi:sugar O-acyltransferase (sialic acid O-acetyltransferase NeuD family)
MKKLAIIGAGLLGKLIRHHAEKKYSVVGFYDDFSSDNGLLGKINDVQLDYSQGNFDVIIIGIGYSQMEARITIFNSFKDKIPFANIIHPSAFIDESVKIGEGVVILPGCIIDMECIIGDNVLLNTGCVIAHHSTINNHCFLGPAVSIAGLVNVLSGSFIGVGSTIKDSVTIGERCILGAGTVVIKNIESKTISVGVPSKIINRI